MKNSSQREAVSKELASGKKQWEAPNLKAGSIHELTGKGSSFPHECDTSSKNAS
jgi:hypothetical protein